MGDLSLSRASTFYGFLVGLCFTPIAVFAAIFSAGAGHGDYVLARILFPLPMLSTLLTNGVISGGAIALGLIQFPLYGILAGWSRRRYFVLTAIAVAHLLLVAAAFSGLLSAFSS